jgi:hypothetical protein
MKSSWWQHLVFATGSTGITVTLLLMLAGAPVSSREAAITLIAGAITVAFVIRKRER